ncbi:MGMT family protein [Elusimicrobiota bacterium]
MGESFRSRVYSALTKIPSGKVTTYKEIANYLNCRAYRAVGTAVASNPLAPQVPCHRVVRTNRSIGEYSGTGGVRKKISLLKKEGIEIKKNKIIGFEKVFFRMGK